MTVTMEWRSRWPQALTIEERANLLNDKPATRVEGSDSVAATRERLWRQLPSFDDAGTFARRLALVGLNDVGFRELLTGLPLPSATPDWAQGVSSVYAGMDADTFETYRADTLPRLQADSPHVWPEALNGLAQPLFSHFLDKAAVEVRRRASELGQSEDIEQILAGRPANLYRLIAPTFVLHMHVKDLLDPKGRDFADHIEELISPRSLSHFLGEHPVLGRVIATMADQWPHAQVALANRYLSDRSSLSQFLGAPEVVLRVLNVAPGLGDPHMGLQSVALLRTNLGPVIYKPTDCRPLEHLSALNKWIRRHSDDRLGFGVPRALARGEYGWAEYVEREPARDDHELSRFSCRMGSLLATAWVLGGTDLHSENIIARYDSPVVVDGETIVGLAAQDDFGMSPLGSTWRRVLASSVLRTGILPQGIPTGPDHVVDMSALGARPGQRFSVKLWRDVGTPNMYMYGDVSERPYSELSSPVTGGTGREAAIRHWSEINSGFLDTCRLLMNHRDMLLSGPDSPISVFGGGRYRVLFRNTASYGRIMRQLSHPDLLSDGLDRSRHLDHLYVGALGNESLEGVAGAERRALDRGDIPYFWTEGDKRDLVSCSGVVGVDLLKYSPVQAAADRLRGLSEEQLPLQSWFLQMSLLSAEDARYGGLVDSPGVSPARLNESLETEVLTAVERLAHEVAGLGYDCGGDGVVWPGMRARSNSNWRIVTPGTGLYDGNAGIALFLGLAGTALGDPKLVTAARRGLTPVIRRVQDGLNRDEIGVFEGSAGSLYVLGCLRQAWAEDYHALEAQLLTHIRDNARRDSGLDVGSGAAGAGLVIGAGLTGWVHRELALEAASECGQRLQETQVTVGDDAVAWPSRSFQGPSLTGFGHGTAGIGLACLRLGSILRDLDLIRLWRKAQQFEAAHFIEARGNWADLRERSDEQDPDTPVAAWCHGAAGIGLSRCLALLANQADPFMTAADFDRVHRDLQAAITATKREGVGKNHSLCHGDLGAMELLLAASDIAVYAGERQYAYGVGARVARAVMRSRPRCGGPLGFVLPGLMTGLSGIGFGLLRCLNRDMPSVCALDFGLNALEATGGVG